MSHSRRLGPGPLSVVALLAATSLAGCGGGEPPPAPGSFPPLHYTYLPPIRLNVASLDVENEAPPNELASRSPVTPADALANMARDRIVPAGPAGTAVFTITDASITRGPDGLTEHLAAHLDIVGTSGAHQGFAEAEVSRSATGDEDVAGPAPLYSLTSQAMQDMNVEFEYQVRRHLADWLVSPGATVEAPVSAAPLPLAPSAAPPVATPPNAFPASPVPPSGVAAPPASSGEMAPPPDSGTEAPPPEMSPPPSVLSLPPPVPGDPAATPDLDVPPPSSQAVPPPAGDYGAPPAGGGYGAPPPGGGY